LKQIFSPIEQTRINVQYFILICIAIKLLLEQKPQLQLHIIKLNLL
jgi:hypothetical protein